MAHNIRLSVITSRFTSMVSVALVLLMVAMAAMAGIAARRIVDDLRGRMGCVVMMSPEASDADVNGIKRALNDAPFVASYTYASPEQVQTRWIEMTGADKVETEAMDIMDVNPFLPEFDVAVKSQWGSSDSLAAIGERIKALPGVEEVGVQADVIDDVNATISSVMTVLGIIALALLVISGVLINNTVRLGVYARRFTIHTMWLVGATRGFIRRPFIRSSVVTGVLAAILADAILAGALAYWSHVDPDMALTVTRTDYACVAAVTLLLGAAICALAAWLATNKYLGKSFDDLFK